MESIFELVPYVVFQSGSLMFVSESIEGAFEKFSDSLDNHTTIFVTIPQDHQHMVYTGHAIGVSKLQNAENHMRVNFEYTRVDVFTETDLN